MHAQDTLLFQGSLAILRRKNNEGKQNFDTPNKTHLFQPTRKKSIHMKTAKDFDEAFDNGEDISELVNWSASRRPNLKQKHVNLNLHRKDILKNLVEFSKPLEALTKELAQLNWDYDDEPFIMTTTHLKSIIARFLLGGISAKEVEDWANLLECREDIAYEQTLDKKIEETLHILANPALEGAITFESCKKIFSALELR